MAASRLRASRLSSSHAVPRRVMSAPGSRSHSSNHCRASASSSGGCPPGASNTWTTRRSPSRRAASRRAVARAARAPSEKSVPTTNVETMAGTLGMRDGACSLSKGRAHDWTARISRETAVSGGCGRVEWGAMPQPVSGAATSPAGTVGQGATPGWRGKCWSRGRGDGYGPSWHECTGAVGGDHSPRRASRHEEPGLAWAWGTMPHRGAWRYSDSGGSLPSARHSASLR